ncbi:MAG: ArsR/SmtB family transcription factor [Acidobacteriota bacterium]
MNIEPTLDHVFAAIADPTRRAILSRLARGDARVTDIAEPFAMSLAAVSKHVQTLERAGLVRRERRGREHTLSLDARPLRQVVRWTSRYERFWNERLDRLEAYFAQKGPGK